MFDSADFGKKLKTLRKERHMTMKNVGDLLGVTSTQVSDIEHGKTTTSLARLWVLCDTFQVSADYLLGLSDDPEIKK